jgi:hypothetical protein
VIKRLLICGSCVALMSAVAIAVVFAVGIELCQREKQVHWREELT